MPGPEECAERRDQLLDALSLAAPVLVVSPHPDDESLGCGGLIARLADAGRPVHVLIVSDGGASHPGSTVWPPRQLAALRRREGEAALEMLGVAPACRHHWGLADGRVPRPGQAGGAALVERAAALIAATGARTLVLPWRHDPHPDHVAVAALFLAAARRVARSPAILEYPIWAVIGRRAGRRGPRMQCWRVDITAVLERKRRAIDQHRSQRGLVVTDAPSGFVIDARVRAAFERAFETYWQEAGEEPARPD